MRSQTFTFSVLALFAANAYACAKYADCKCHDSNTGQQNDSITKQACEKYNKDKGSGVTYSDTPHHQCAKNDDIGGGLMDNCDWDDICKSFGSQYYQYCWNKDCVAGIFC